MMGWLAVHEVGKPIEDTYENHLHHNYLDATYSYGPRK